MRLALFEVNEAMKCFNEIEHLGYTVKSRSMIIQGLELQAQTILGGVGRKQKDTSGTGTVSTDDAPGDVERDDADDAPGDVERDDGIERVIVPQTRDDADDAEMAMQMLQRLHHLRTGVRVEMRHWEEDGRAIILPQEEPDPDAEHPRHLVVLAKAQIASNKRTMALRCAGVRGSLFLADRSLLPHE